MLNQQELRWESRYPNVISFNVKHTNKDGTVVLPAEINGGPLTAFDLRKANSCAGILNNPGIKFIPKG